MAYIKNLDEIKKESKKINVEDVLNWISPGIKTFKSGDEIRSRCIVHGGNGPNLSINKKTHEWICHSKGCSGTNSIDLYAQSKGYASDKFHEAAEEFAEKFGIEIEYEGREETKKYTPRTPQQVIKESSEAGFHHYLKRKCLNAWPGLRFGRDERGNHSIIIPFHDVDGSLQTIQFINDNPIKPFLKDFKMIGSFFKVGEINKTVYLGEGAATMLTIWEALEKQATIISVGSATNIPHVVKALKDKYKALEIIICMDDSEAADSAIKRIESQYRSACSYRRPNFTKFPNPNNEELADFNDIVSKCGSTLEEVKRQLEIEYFPLKKEVKKEETKAADKSNHGRCENAGELLKRNGFLDCIKNRMLNQEIKLSGIPTQFKLLDEIIDGLQGGHLIIFAGRTAMGKTYAALNILKNIAIQQKIPSSLYSLEMSNVQVFYRLISILTGISATRIKRGSINESELAKIEEAIRKIEDSPLFVTDNPTNSNLSSVYANMKKGCDAGEAKLIFVDHIGLINCGSNYRDNRANELGKISMTFKLLAKEQNIPIICLAQLNREADKKDTPQLSQLRESGNLEQDADIVMFIHRRDYYDPQDKPGQANIIVAKNREGECGTVNFKYSKDNWLLEELEPLKNLMSGTNSPQIPNGHAYSFNKPH